MVYIYKKVIYGKPYYYLRISKRIGGKIIVKDIAYLGNDALELEKKLNKLTSHKKEIRKAYHNIKKFIQGEYYLNKIKKLKLRVNPYVNKKSLEEIEAIKLHYNNFLRKDNQTKEDVYKDFLIDFAYNTTSLEGNTITLQEVNKLLKENLTPKNRTLREIYDLQNTEKVFFDILKSKQEINNALIIKIHDELLDKIDQRKGYRLQDIRVLKSHFKTTPYPYINADMKILLKLYTKNKDKIHPLVLAGIIHQKFEKIHPFADGNGRTGRMMLDYILIKNKYPPLIIKKSRRGDYLDAISKGDKADLNNIDAKYYKDIVGYLAEEMISSYWSNFNI